MKYEWRKIEKVLYQIKDKPTILQVPSKSYIIIDGKGDPNEEDFSQRVSALYALAYAIKMKYKKSPLDQDYMDFTVFPLAYGNRIMKGNLLKVNYLIVL